MSALTLTSTAFQDNQPIPPKFTGDGRDLSPPLQWTPPPEGTRELALIVDDPDAPTPEPWVHWVLYKIPQGTTSLPEGIAPGPRAAQPAGALQGANSWPQGVGYRGPAPPKGHGVHHYHFRLFALDSPLNVGPGLDKRSLIAAMRGHILAEASLVGTYER
jgi:Raf kinase inhibitor-like YbhB/YbcL family protein